MDEIQKADRYLSQLHHLDQRISILKSELADWHDRAAIPAHPLTGMPGRATPYTHQLSDCIDAICTLEDELADAINNTIALTGEIKSVIAQVSHPLYHALLYAHYVGNLHWAQVAEQIPCSPTHVYRLRKQALSEVSTILAARGK